MTLHIPRHLNHRRVLRLAALAVVVLLAASGAGGLLASGGMTMDKGVVFFAPVTSESWHGTLSSSVRVTGTEVFLMWSDIEAVEGVYDWSDIDRIRDRYAAQGKKIVFRVSTAAFSPNDSPAWLYNRYHVRRITYGSFLGFEKGSGGLAAADGSAYQLLSGGTVVREAAKVLSGSASLEMAGGDGIDSGSSPLDLQNGVSVGLDFKAVSSGRLVVDLRRSDGTRVSLQSWTLSAGDRGSRVFDIPAASLRTGDKVVFSAPEGRFLLDNLDISSNRAGFHVGNLCFPNYFDPVFRDRFGRFIEALAAKYGDDPHVAAVNIGGYGRWEELTLSGDGDPQGLAEQWTTFAGTADRTLFSQKYVEHVKWVVDAFDDAFRPDGKPLFMCAIGFPGADAFRDQEYIDWKVTGYLAKKGIGIKYNGWQAMAGDWGSSLSAIFYQVNRYRHVPGLTILYEQGAQVNSTLSEVMGHPLSMANRVLIDGVDYFWMYENDIREPVVDKYLHYMSEQAGAALFTRLYNLPGRFPYKTYVHYNRWLGIYQTHTRVTATGGVYRVTVPGEFVTLDGVSAVRSTSLLYSIDDRQKHNGAYGSVVSLVYLDDNTDRVTIRSNADGGQVVTATFDKTGTGLWKRFAFLDNRPMNGRRNSGTDMTGELMIAAAHPVTLAELSVDFVPAREWQEEIVAQRSVLDPDGKELGTTATSFEVDQPEGRSLSGLAVEVSPIGAGSVSVMARVFAVTGSGSVLVTEKEHSMPADRDRLYLPVANAPTGTLRFRVELTRTLGRAALATGSGGQPAYEALAFRGAAPDAGLAAAFASGDAVIAPGSPFFALDLKTTGKVSGSLYRVLPDGSLSDKAASFSVDPATARPGAAAGTLRAPLQPLPAGRYRIRLAAGSAASAVPVPLARLQPANPPVRDLLGSAPVPAWAAAAAAPGFWRPVSGFTDIAVSGSGLSARIASPEPILETAPGLSYAASNQQVLHLVLKNETGSGLAKVYWKTAADGWSEVRSALVPVVPNDTEWREYSWPIGQEPGYAGTITGLRFVPVTGSTDTGRIGLRLAEIRSDAVRQSGYRVPLRVQDLPADSFAPAGDPSAAPSSTPSASPTSGPTTDPSSAPSSAQPTDPGGSPAPTHEGTPGVSTSPGPTVDPGAATPTPDAAASPTGGPSPSDNPDPTGGPPPGAGGIAALAALAAAGATGLAAGLRALVRRRRRGGTPT